MIPCRKGGTTVKKRLMTVLSVICCIALNGTTGASAFTAEDAAQIVQEFIEQAENVNYTPIRPAEIIDGAGPYVNQYQVDVFGCLAVTCSDYAALEGSTLNGQPINIKDDTDSEGEAIIVWPFSRYVDHVRQFLSDLGEEVYGQNGRQVASGNLYVMDLAGQEDIPGFLNAVTEDERFGLIGLLSVHYEAKAVFDSDLPYLYLEAAEGHTIDPDALNTPEYRHITPASDGDYQIGDSDSLSFDDAVTLCEKLEQRDDIAFAWMVGALSGPNEEAGDEKIYFRLTPFDPRGSGDLNQDGKTNICDAVLLARYNAEDPEVPITEAGLAEADFNGDGFVDAADYRAIMQYLA